MLLQIPGQFSEWLCFMQSSQAHDSKRMNLLHYIQCVFIGCHKIWLWWPSCAIYGCYVTRQWVPACWAAIQHGCHDVKGVDEGGERSGGEERWTKGGTKVEMKYTLILSKFQLSMQDFRSGFCSEIWEGFRHCVTSLTNKFHSQETSPCRVLDYAIFSPAQSVTSMNALAWQALNRSHAISCCHALELVKSVPNSCIPWRPWAGPSPRVHTTKRSLAFWQIRGSRIAWRSDHNRCYTCPSCLSIRRTTWIWTLSGRIRTRVHRTHRMWRAFCFPSCTCAGKQGVCCRLLPKMTVD